MAASNTDKFKKAKRKFSTTTSGVFSAGATTLPLTSTSGLDTDTAITLVLDAGTASEEVITGVVSGSNVVNCVRGKEGTSDVSHANGAAVTMYFTETHWDDLITGILVSHNQDGTLANNSVTAASITDGVVTNAKLNSDLQQGWINLNDTPDTITYNGNRNYDLVFNSVDLSSTISPGQKLKLTRTVAAPTQCTDLESGSSQYYSKTSPAGMTFTDDFVVSAWVKLESYGLTTVASRYNGTSGWVFRVGALGSGDGRIQLMGTNGGSTNYSAVVSYASLPLNKWVHITAQLDMSSFTATSTTSYIMIDGVDVPAFVQRGGTNPTALVQAGNLEIGSENGGTQPFDGKLAQVAIFNAKVTQATMRGYISQGLSGSETSLISAYSFNNSINDLNTTNANNLTANGSAVATNADSPFANAVSAGLQEYAEINSVTFSTNTTVNVRVPETSMIPTSGGISNTYYSVGVNPYGLPYFSNVLGYAAIQVSDTTGGTAEADVNGLSITVNVPTNAKIKVSSHCNCYNTTGAAYSIIKIKEGSTSYQAGVGSQAGANSPQLVTAMADLLPTAGSHTYKLSHTASGGNKAIEASTSEPAFIKVELV